MGKARSHGSRSRVPSGVRMRQRGRLRDVWEEFGEAFALAEAGEQLLAQEVLRRGSSQGRRILVLGHGADFFPVLAEYALGLAQRMDYEVVFCNVRDAGGGGGTAAMRQHMEETFAAQAGRAVQPWLERAAQMGVAARHVVRSGCVTAQVEAICHELGRVELVLSGPDESMCLEGHVSSPLFTVE
ncbi:MAG: hypothetical protein JG760_1124 [Desulfomicrobiaceae bacterium]|nr:hypothetical protein [Desulfomicrobiaceae bacterium]MDI3493685.1 hypothetical protein [Desulfomicrobiaceae bacterium]